MTLEHTRVIQDSSFSESESSSKEGPLTTSSADQKTFRFPENQKIHQELQIYLQFSYNNIEKLPSTFINLVERLTTGLGIDKQEVINAQVWLEIAKKYTNSANNLVSIKNSNDQDLQAYKVNFELLKIMFMLNFSRHEAIRKESSVLFHKFYEKLLAEKPEEVSTDGNGKIIKDHIIKELYKTPNAIVEINNLFENHMPKTQTKTKTS